MTEAEAMLWSALRGRRLDGYKFRRQVPIDWFVVDFLCSQAQLIVEIDGHVHETQQEYDHDREEEIRKRGYKLVRFTNDDVRDQMPIVLQKIRQALSPLPGGRTGLRERGRG